MENYSVQPELPVNDCCGCGTCVAICSHQAVLLEIASCGFYSPVISSSLCVNCLKCMDVCEYKSKVTDEKLLDRFDAYLAGSVNNKIKIQGSSGGFITQYLIDCLESGEISGAVVVGSVSDPFRPGAIVARTQQDVLNATGSKYCPIPVNIILSQVDWSAEKIAYVGLPCQISRLKKYLISKYGSKFIDPIVIGLFCNHTPSFKATEFLMSLYNIKKDTVKKISFRSGEWPGYVQFVKKDESLIRLPYMQAWASGFGFFFHNDACLNCKDFVSAEADINVGDPWGLEKSVCFGKSMIFINREKKELLGQCRNIEIVELDEAQQQTVNRKLSRGATSSILKLFKKLGCCQLHWPFIQIFSKMLTWKKRMISISLYYLNKFHIVEYK